MPQYMTQFTYTPEAWAALVANPTDRSEGLRALMEKLGGRLISFHYTMGKWDGVIISEAPDDASAAAGVMAVLSAGHLKATRMTRLIPVSEAMDAMRKAQGVKYAPPSR